MNGHDGENQRLKAEHDRLRKQMEVVRENQRLHDEIEKLQSQLQNFYSNRDSPNEDRDTEQELTASDVPQEEDYSTFSEGDAGSFLQLISMNKDDEGNAVGVVIGHDENGEEMIRNPDGYYQFDSTQKSRRRNKKHRQTAAAKAKRAARKKEKMAELKERARQGEEVPVLQHAKEKRARRRKMARIYRRTLRETQNLDFISSLLDTAKLEASKAGAVAHLQALHARKLLPAHVRQVLSRESKAQLMRGLLAGEGGAVPEDVLAFFVIDLGVVVVKYLEWLHLLPRVAPFYAMKCNPDPMMVATLKHLGAGFDCASKAELELALVQGVPPEKIIFANPVKQPAHLRFALERGVRMMTFDNEEEVRKIQRYHPQAQLVLRLLPDDSHSKMPFGIKFGASRDESQRLIALCRELHMDLIGVSFHVGSGCMDPVAFTDAITLARWAFDVARGEGFQMRLLDIGGGWPGVFDATARDDDAFSFEDVTKVIRPLLDDLFPASSGVQLIAEPGRYFATAAASLAVQVVAKRTRVRGAYAFKNENRISIPARGDGEKEELTLGSRSREDDGEEKIHETLYYMADGIYGSFNNIVFDHAKPLPCLLKSMTRPDVFMAKPNEMAEEETFRSSLFGPTCDSIDIICKDIQIPNLEVGDWLYFSNMGAYTSAAASAFNGFALSPKFYIMRMAPPLAPGALSASAGSAAAPAGPGSAAIAASAAAPAANTVNPTAKK